MLHGDPASEQFLSEMFNPAAFEARHMSMEGIYPIYTALRPADQNNLIDLIEKALAIVKH